MYHTSHRIITSIICCILAITSFAGTARQKLMTYPAPAGAELKTDFTVKVRNTDSNTWQSIPTYAVKVAKNNVGSTIVEKASMSYFDFKGEVEVSITCNNADIHTARIRPLSYGITPVISGRNITFRLTEPRNLSIEVNGDIFHNLHLFANPVANFRPTKKGKNLIYFGPGIHKLPGDSLYVASGQSVYIAGGAIVQGALKIDGVHDVQVSGRGEIHPAGRGAGIYISNARNISVEGIITTQCPVGGSDSVRIDNVKTISSYGWGDGLNIFASSNVFFDHVFCRTSDDCTTIYATRMGFTGSSRNIIMQNATLWADVAHPIFIGLHGNTEYPDTIENALYRNIDILDQCEPQIDYQGCMAINCGDNNTVRNIRFENIRVEDFRMGQLIDLRVSLNKKYCLAPGRSIEHISFKDITYNGHHADISLIAGYDDQRTISDVRFENLEINGTAISDSMKTKPKWYKTSDFARIFIGEHVQGVQFLP